MSQLFRMSPPTNTILGFGAPTSTPTKEGDIYVDTLNDETYISAGTSSSSDWKKSSGSSADEAQTFFAGN